MECCFSLDIVCWYEWRLEQNNFPATPPKKANQCHIESIKEGDQDIVYKPYWKDVMSEHLYAFYHQSFCKVLLFIKILKLVTLKISYCPFSFLLQTIIYTEQPEYIYIYI